VSVLSKAKQHECIRNLKNSYLTQKQIPCTSLSNG